MVDGCRGPAFPDRIQKVGEEERGLATSREGPMAYSWPGQTSKVLRIYFHILLISRDGC